MACRSRHAHRVEQTHLHAAQGRAQRSARARRVALETLRLQPPGWSGRRNRAQGRCACPSRRAQGRRAAHAGHALRARGPALPRLQRRDPADRRILFQVRTCARSARSLSLLALGAERDQTQAALQNLSRFADDEVLEPINGVSYTTAELRKRVVWEQRGVLIVNLILCAIMLVLGWWSRSKPLPAILIATAIYVAVQVISAIMDPTTIMQGFIMKAVIIAILVRGIKGALSARTENG